MSAPETKKFYAFYNRVPNSNYIFPDGTQANFTNGRYTTEDTNKASILQEVVAQGNPHIYVDAEKLQLTAEELDPMAELKARIIAEYEATKATNKGEMGAYVPQKLTPADSNSVGAAAADSSSGATPAPSLAGIKVGSLAK